MSHRPHPSKNKGKYPDHHGRQWWQIETWPDGKTRDPATRELPKRDTIVFFGTKTEARLYDEELQSPATHTHARNPRLKEITASFLADYQHEVTVDTVKDFRQAYNRFADHFGPLRLSQITNAIVQQYKNQRLAQTWKGKPITKRTVNRELSYLSSMVRWAENQEPPLVEPGTVRIKLFPKKQTKSAAPIIPHTFEEAADFLQAIGDTTVYDGKAINAKRHKQMARDRYGLSLLMYDAGLRKKEARLIEANRISLPPSPSKLPGETALYYGTITVIRKGGKVQTLPILTERLYQELKSRLEATPSGYLYISPITTEPYKDIRSGLQAAGTRAGITKKTNPHLFRHDFVTHLHETGADMRTIQELVGHSTITTTAEIYSHLTTNTLRHRAGGFAERINTVRARPKKKAE